MKQFLMVGLLASVFAVTNTINAADKAADKADAKTEKKSEYPLKKCVVADEDLGSMGKPYTFKHEGREVQLCCSSCKKDFDKEPAKYIKKIEEAEKKAAKK